MNYQYYFCIPYQQKLISLLNANNIRHRLSGSLGECFRNGLSVPVFVIFTIKGHLPIVDRIAEEFRYSPQVNIVYTSTEVNNAKLLWMTPKKQSIDLLRSETSFSYLCSWNDAFGTRRVHIKEQIAPLTIAKEPSMTTKTAFWSSSTGFSEIFTDKRVRELAISHNLHGIEFMNTMLPNGSCSENIFQLTAHKHITTECVVFGHGEKEVTCARCERKQYEFDNTYQLHLSFAENDFTDDMFVTERIFGTGIPRPLYLISQRFYRILKQNDLTANVTFEPVVIV